MRRKSWTVDDVVDVEFGTEQNRSKKGQCTWTVKYKINRISSPSNPCTNQIQTNITITLREYNHTKHDALDIWILQADL